LSRALLVGYLKARRSSDLNKSYYHVLGEIMFPPELERNAFRADNGEYGWTRAQIPQVVNILRSRRMAILGGELWWVKDGSTSWDLITQRDGRRAVYTWAGDRIPGEPWPDFVERGAADALAHVELWPTDDDLLPNLEGRILCNLCWVSHLEFDQLTRKNVKHLRPHAR
jgi:hypothetical protein